MDAKELLNQFKDLKMVEVVRYDPDIYCDVSTIPKWNVPEKIILGVAITGSFIDKRQNPNQPYTAKEILAESMACIEAGCTALHFHIRDEAGNNVGSLEKYREIIDPIRQKYGDTVFIDGCPLFGKDFEEANAPLTEGLFELGIVNSVCTFVGENVRWLPPPVIKAQARYLNALGIPILVSVHDTASIDNINRFLIRPGILQKPYYFGILADLPGMFYMPNPRAMVEGITLLVNRIREIDATCPIQLCGSGRASIYLATLGVLMGFDQVRVGTEDTIWRYPHRDEKILSNVQVFKTAKGICELLGREIATADDYRKMLGIKKA
jgi:3-keto-5-aminohexanoate cleavage enzyme